MLLGHVFCPFDKMASVSRLLGQPTYVSTLNCRIIDCQIGQCLKIFCLPLNSMWFYSWVCRSSSSIEFGTRFSMAIQLPSVLNKYSLFVLTSSFLNINVSSLKSNENTQR